MRRLKVVVILSLILSGCATLLEHQPIAIRDIELALSTIESTINHNPHKRGIEVDFVNERVLKLKGRVGLGMPEKVVLFKLIGRMTLHTKRDWFILTIFNTFNKKEVQFVLKDEFNAKQLLNAFYSLKKHKPSQYNEYMVQVNQGGVVKKIPSRAEASQLAEANSALKKEIEALRLATPEQSEWSRVKEQPRPKSASERLDAMGIVTTVDDFDGITWYKDAESSKAMNFKTRMFAYIAKKDNAAPILRMKLRYYADDWLFAHSFAVMADGKKFTFNGKPFEKDNGSGSIWEWYDARANKSALKMLKAVAKAKKAVVRFYGDKYHADHRISDDEKRGIETILTAFYDMK